MFFFYFNFFLIPNTHVLEKVIIIIGTGMTACAAHRGSQGGVRGTQLATGSPVPAAKRLERQQCTMEKAAEMPTLEGWSTRMT